MNRHVRLHPSPRAAFAETMVLACCLIALALALALPSMAHAAPDSDDESVAYAFLFENDLLYLKAGGDRPGDGVVPGTERVKARYRWFDEGTPDPGASIPWKKKLDRIKRVVIEDSFARFSPVTTEAWFAGCTALTKVEGLGYIDGSQLTSVARMFEGCNSLKELDLSGLDASAARDCSRFLRNCSALELLDLGNLNVGKAAACDGFFDGCKGIISLKTGNAWENAVDGLAFAADAYRVSPSYRKFPAGSALPSGAGEYRFADLPMQSTKVVLPKSSYDCTGREIRPKPAVTFGEGCTLREGVDYTLAYGDNVYPGTAHLTIKGKGAFDGGLIVDFKIAPVISKAGEQVSYLDKTAKYKLKVRSVKKKGGRVVSADAAVVGIEVANKKAKTLTIPNSCTVGGVKVTITVVSSKLVGNFRNVASVVIGPKVASIGERAFSKAKKVRSLIVKTARLTQAANCLKGSKVAKVQVKVALSKAKRAKYQAWFTEKSGKSGVRYAYR